MINEWQFYFSFLKLKPMMRRKIKGKWEYRHMTKEEEQDYISSEAW